MRTYYLDNFFGGAPRFRHFRRARRSAQLLEHSRTAITTDLSLRFVEVFAMLAVLEQVAGVVGNKTYESFNN